MADAAYLGPGPELIRYVSIASQAPIWGEWTDEESDAFQERFIAARVLEDLPESDQAFLARAVAVVEAGGSPTLADYDSDWAAEDALLDAEDETKAAPDDGEWVGL